VVGFAEDVAPEDFREGDEVFLLRDMTLIVGRSPGTMSRSGEIGDFDRLLSDGRLVLRSRDEEFVVDPGSALSGIRLEPGDSVRFDRNTWIAYEKVERPPSRQYLMNEVPDIGPEHFGGQEATVKKMLRALTGFMADPEKAKAYGHDGRTAILLEGPPGCGKTLLARVGMAYAQRVSGRRCTFSLVKPAEWESPFVGETQRNIRNAFRSMREAVGDGYGAMYLDELDAAGRMRGGLGGHHSDKFLAALLTEIEGFDGQANIALIGATNRADLLEPALEERFSQIRIHVARPDMRGARAIFGIHLPETIPVSPNGARAAATRNEIIDSAVSRLYGQCADNEISVIRFRDGKTRTVFAHELMSGRVIRQICRNAADAALERDIENAGTGLRVEDMDQAVNDAIARLSATISPYNVRAHLSDVPLDADVVAVEPVKRRAANPHRYFNVENN
jgi:proteasome-associated ATPase